MVRPRHTSRRRTPEALDATVNGYTTLQRWQTAVIVTITHESRCSNVSASGWRNRTSGLKGDTKTTGCAGCISETFPRLPRKSSQGAPGFDEPSHQGLVT